jgi:hypothetical protein
MRFSVVGEKSAFCSGGVATAEEPSTVRTPSLQPTGKGSKHPGGGADLW